MTSALADAQADYNLEINPLTNPFFSTLIDWDSLYLSLNTYRISRGYFNLVIEQEVLKELIARNNYQLWILRNKFDSKEFEIKAKLNRYAEMILKDYVNKYSADIEKKHLTNNLKAQLLNS